VHGVGFLLDHSYRPIRGLLRYIGFVSTPCCFLVVVLRIFVHHLRCTVGNWNLFLRDFRCECIRFINCSNCRTKSKYDDTQYTHSTHVRTIRHAAIRTQSVIISHLCISKLMKTVLKFRPILSHASTHAHGAHAAVTQAYRIFSKHE